MKTDIYCLKCVYKGDKINGITGDVNEVRRDNTYKSSLSVKAVGDFQL